VIGDEGGDVAYGEAGDGSDVEIEAPPAVDEGPGLSVRGVGGAGGYAGHWTWTEDGNVYTENGLGGRGGDARVTAGTGGALHGDAGGVAIAIGGAGGQAEGGDYIIYGEDDIYVWDAGGVGGRGGEAWSQGGSGGDSGAGGVAVATGGAGAVATDNHENNRGGNGGDATARGGGGGAGDGSCDEPGAGWPGGAGGDAQATGGDGGDGRYESWMTDRASQGGSA